MRDKHGYLILPSDSATHIYPTTTYPALCIALNMMTSMRPSLCLSLLLSLASWIATAAPSDEEAIRATISKYVLARNLKAPDRLRSLFTADADQLVSTGEWRHGIDELQA